MAQSQQIPSRAALQAIAPVLDYVTQERLLDEVWKRPGLDARDRSIITLAALIARNQRIELPFYLNRALDSAVKPLEISEIITASCVLLRMAQCHEAVAAATDVFATRKISADQLPTAAGARLHLDVAAEARSPNKGASHNAVCVAQLRD